MYPEHNPLLSAVHIYAILKARSIHLPDSQNTRFTLRWSWKQVVYTIKNLPIHSVLITNRSHTHTHTHTYIDLHWFYWEDNHFYNKNTTVLKLRHIMCIYSSENSTKVWTLNPAVLPSAKPFTTPCKPPARNVNWEINTYIWIFVGVIGTTFRQTIACLGLRCLQREWNKIKSDFCQQPN